MCRAAPWTGAAFFCVASAITSNLPSFSPVERSREGEPHELVAQAEGSRYALLQAFGWTLMALEMVLLVASTRGGGLAAAYGSAGAVGVGVVGLTAQGLLLASKRARLLSHDGYNDAPLAGAR